MIRYTTIKEIGKDINVNVNYENYDENLVNKTYVESFVRCTVEGVQDKIYDARLLTFDLGKLAAAIKPERDFLFQYLGMTINNFEAQVCSPYILNSDIGAT